MTEPHELDAFRKRVSCPQLRNFEKRIRRLFATVPQKLDIAAARGETSICLSVDCYPRFIDRFATSQVWDELDYRCGSTGLYWAKDNSGQRDTLVFSRQPL